MSTSSSGEPLFSCSRSLSPAPAGCFLAAVQHQDGTTATLGMSRVEVHLRIAWSHLGHVFEDGPPPTGLRLLHGLRLQAFFAERLAEEGYGAYAGLFPEVKAAPPESRSRHRPRHRPRGIFRLDTYLPALRVAPTRQRGCCKVAACAIYMGR